WCSYSEVSSLSFWVSSASTLAASTTKCGLGRYILCARCWSESGYRTLLASCSGKTTRCKAICTSFVLLATVLVGIAYTLRDLEQEPFAALCLIKYPLQSVTGRRVAIPVSHFVRSPDILFAVRVAVHRLLHHCAGTHDVVVLVG